MLALRFVFGLLMVILVVGLIGCTGRTTKEKEQDVSPQTSSVPPVKESSVATTEEGPSGLMELSVEDRELAKKQKVCPVSGDALGTMGKPFKTVVSGKTVFLCCPGCEKEFQSNAEKYYLKMEKQR